MLRRGLFLVVFFLAVFSVANATQSGAPANVTPHQIRISSKVAADRCVSCPLPAYPASATEFHETGEVLMDIVIGTDGAVENPQVMSGPKLLRQAALDAIRTWKYKPFMLHGQGVPVATQVTMRFTLNGHE